jgi:hypothetical protein
MVGVEETVEAARESDGMDKGTVVNYVKGSKDNLLRNAFPMALGATEPSSTHPRIHSSINLLFTFGNVSRR